MGWSFSSSANQSASPVPTPSNDGAYIAPDRVARAQCWEGRDSFFTCLDKHGVIDSVKEKDKAARLCAPELKEFERACASSWVAYFKKRRVMEYQRDQTLKKLSAEGSTPLSPGTGSPGR